MKTLVARLLALLGASLVCAYASPAAAGAGGFSTVTATPIVIRAMVQAANTTVAISTSNLTVGSDTVVHVQNTSGGFIAGNDDISPTNHASQLTVPAVSTARTITILVRAYDNSTAGTATLTIAPQGAQQTVETITFAGTQVMVAPDTLPVGSHVFTGQTPGGASDTVLLVTQTTTGHAFGYDDDLGADNMSNITLPEACTSNCRLTVGTFQTGMGQTTAYWDSKTADADSDGVGDVLESKLMTSDSNSDSDQDGLSDLLEIAGSDSPDPASLNYPKMGAKPKQPDLFLEADWIKCTTCGNVDENQVTGADAVAFANAYAPDIAVHIDTGVTNTSGQNLGTWGNWGGAVQDTDQSIVACRGLSSSRNTAKTFFHMLANSWQNQTGPGKCVISNRVVGDAAHETGHALFLDHGGTSSTIKANCKPNYKSMMNYEFEFNMVGFSRNTLGVTINPTSMDEDSPFGSADISYLANSSTFGFKIQGTHVDWNRDGIFAPAGTRVRAAPNAANDATNCSPHVDRQSFFPTFDTTEAAGTWVTVAAPENARFYLFTRRTSTGFTQLRTAKLADMQNCATQVQPNPGLASPCVTWSPVSTSEATSFSTGFTSTSPAAAAFTPPSGGNGRVLLAFVNINGLVTYEINTPGATPAADSWSLLANLPGGLIASGDPALIAKPDGSQVTLFFPSGGTLKSAVFSPSTNTFSSPVTELWADGTSVAATLGVGLTWGYESTQSGQRMYAAIPFNGTQTGQIQFARRDPTTSRWTKISLGEDSYTRTNYRPALAFVPFDKSVSATVGRFYWVHNLPDDGRGRLAFTEGNDSAAGATTRRMNVMAYRQFTTQATQGGMSFFYDPVRDDNLRLAYTYVCPGCPDNQHYRMSFFPNADGIVNAQYADEDDYAILKNNLRASLGYSAPVPIQ